MDEHIKAFFQPVSDDFPGGHFRKVIPLHQDHSLPWDELSRMVPTLPRGWFELSLLPTQDRIEFIHDFWLMKLPYHPALNAFLMDFFASLYNISVFVTQRKFDDPMEAHLVYGLDQDRGFFRGSPPATDQDIVTLQSQFPEFVLPVDYLAFMQIHDGFYKFTDTGLVTTKALLGKYREFQMSLDQKEPLLSAEGSSINPRRLIPFYESFGFPCYQCFWADWYPDHEMGNIYYSGLTHTISNHTLDVASPENMSFPSFTDWLMFYLETIKI